MSILAESLWREFPASTRPALHGVSLEIESGATAIVLGPSGSGKSTLLNLLGGLDQPTRGTVRVLGHELSAMNEKLLANLRGRQIGIMFQHHFLPAGMTARDTVAAPLLWTKQLSPRKAGKRALEILTRLGLVEDEIERPVQHLSGGQRQRVAFARAIAPGPAVLLCDEPIAQLDSDTASVLITALKDWATDGNRTIVIASHEPIAEFDDAVHYQLDRGELV